jgi:multisubunit Na+/H+ antiporter MnhB subunit
MIEALWALFDVFLVLLVLALGWGACSTQNVIRAIILFIAMGLTLTLCWARLRAPDLALAEAVIGAGISGALLLSAIRDYPSQPAPHATPFLYRWIVNLMTLALLAICGWALWHGFNMSDGERLAGQVMDQLASSGVSNPVTAVLLNFRAYDTLLELAVVLTAVLSVLMLNPRRTPMVATNSLLQGMSHWLVPLLVVTAGYLLWVGAHEPGGAFQAGGMLAAGLILSHLSHPATNTRFNVKLLRMLLVVGLLVFVSCGLWMMSAQGVFLEYNPQTAGAAILIIETTATLSIASGLTLAYLGGRLEGWEPEPTGLRINSPQGASQ